MSHLSFIISHLSFRPLAVLLALFAWLAPQQAQADDMLKDKYYTMNTYTDHVSFEVLLTDLYANNTWAREGVIKAYEKKNRGGTSYELVRVYTKEMDDDEEEYYNVWVTNKRSTAKVWLSNAQYGSKEIGTSEVETKVYKGRKSDRTYAKLDYYYGPEMAGKKWYFYYCCELNYGDKPDHYLGSADLSNTMGLKQIDLAKYKCERTGPKQFSFTPPALPGDVSKDLRDIRKRYGKYLVTMTYHLYGSDKTVVKTDTIDCPLSEVGATYSDSYNIEIPDEVGNYRRVDMKVEATERLDGSNANNGADGTCYWKNSASYTNNDIALTVPVASKIETSFLQFEKKIVLTWYAYDDVAAGKYYSDSEPYIYRIETDENGTPLSGQSWSRRTRLDSISTKTTLTYTDRGAEMNKYYRYMIMNVPKRWQSKGFISDADLKSPTDDLIKQLGCCQSDKIKTEPTVTISNLAQDMEEKKQVRLTWQYSRVPVSQQTVDFYVYRRQVGTTQWTELGKVTTDANPSANAVCEIYDKDLPNSSVSFEYQVTLDINNKANHFHSDVVAAGLLSRTTVTEMTATQGTYAGGVRVSWKADHVGTDDAQYRVYRRYLGSNDEYYKVYDGYGKSSSYSFVDDKGVQPGYYYEYKIEVHQGEVGDANTMQNTLKAVGFAQARGIVAGRITYAASTTSTTPVEGARVSLRPSDGSAISTSSQRVDGASSGIQWKADSTEMAKVFGPDKNFTVQMFVRPDSALSEGAVIGEIPGEGRLVVGKQTIDGYELNLQKITGYAPTVKVAPMMVDNTVDLSKLTGNYEAKNGDVLTNKLGGNYKISIADGASVKLKNVTIEGVNSQSYKWAGITCPGNATIVLEGENTLRGFEEGYPGIYIAENKTLTIKGIGSLSASSTGYAPGIGGTYYQACGNIVIEGGTITAHGGKWSAGIGSAFCHNCGDITIKGGDITANGGEYSAGIGAGDGGICGNITIKNTVTSVKATKDSNGAPHCIGHSTSEAAHNSSCGTVTIGDVVYWDGSTYKNGGENIITQMTYTYSPNGSWQANDHSNSDPVFTHIKEGYTIPGYITYSTAASTGLKLSANAYSLLTVSRTGDNLSFLADNSTGKTLTANKYAHLMPFSVGGADSVKTAQAFKGNLTEVRVWNKALTETEKAACADRVLNGRENNLALYWPMDEGLSNYVFDASFAKELPNGRHGTVGINISTSTMVPTEQQLSRYGVTDKNGRYEILGIPFLGEATGYTLTPTLGIHEFLPESQSVIINANNQTKDQLDFSDKSSFPLRGQVTYLGTNIPVDSVQFMIDGSLIQSKEGVYSDANGNYEISVPIGNHRIECMKNGHRLTSFPLDKTQTYDFHRAEVCNFVDSTLVNVTGRVNGGFSDQEAPVGFGQSKNRIGKAEIKLSLGKESQCSFNYIVDDRGNGSFGTTNMPVASASKDIKSTAYRSGTTHDKTTDNDNTHYIYITTDSVTGEFSALLPPLKYVVESIRMVGGNAYNDEQVFTQNLPTIDATTADEKKLKYDSLTVDGVTKKYEYSAKMIRQLRVQPDITVKQLNLPAGMFGELKVAYTNDKFETDSIVVLNPDNLEKKYTFGHPVFVQSNTYGFSIDVAENYTNQDTKKTIKEYPQDAWIHISNDASATTTIYGNKGAIGKDSVEMGMPYETMQVEIQPDEYGHAEYEFVAGAPNMAEGHLLGMSMSVEVNKRTTMWKAPDSQSDALDLIVLGAIGSGTNFVTYGPDEIDMILRRPPGSTSVARLTNKEVTVNSLTKVNTDGHSAGGGLYVSEAPTFDNLQGAIGPITLLTGTKWKIVTNQTVKRDNRYSDTELAQNDSTYTVTTAMATPGSMQWDAATNSYIPEAGDTYIGRSTNMLFSRGRILGIFKNANTGQYGIEERSGITVGQELRTYFVFPQAYVLNTLIPEWEELITSRLKEGYINADHTDSTNCPKVPGKVMYYTKYKPGDREFGKANGDLSFWTKAQIDAAKGHPSYFRRVDDSMGKDTQDEVENAINQIKRWREVIAVNEEEKVNAFGNSELLIDNYSIASGSSVSRTEEWTYTQNRTEKHDSTYCVTLDINAGAMINEAGGYAIINSAWTWGRQTSTGKTSSTSTSVAWTMSDADARTALSVDVYKSKNGWGPIFRTRGGQTANPYEDGSVTMFYDPGTKLNEATMRVEKPELHVKGATEITDVPTGGKALFTLQMKNMSESNSVCNYVLQVVDKTNPNGAVLTIDGNILSNGKDGRLIKFNPNEEMLKTLVVTQSNEAVVNYEDIELVLRSQNDATIVSDPVKLRVHFVPASSPVELAVDHTVLNEKDKTLYGGVMATMSGFDRNGDRLKGVRLRYRLKGTDAWKQLAIWSNDPTYWQQGAKELRDSSAIKEQVVFNDDGLYELQAQTWGLYGGSEVTYQSNIVEIRQDTHGPKLLGMVSPENGLLTWLNRNNMHIRFNEELNVNAISQSDNIIIEGGLNDVVVDPKRPYPDVALQLNGDSVTTEAIYDLSDTGFALDMWLYRQGDGKIISIGTNNNLLSLSTHDGGLVSASLGSEDNVMDAIERLPENTWTYMAMNYKPNADDKSMGEVTLLYATANDKAKYVFRNEEIEALDCHGKLSVGGSGMQGMIGRLSVWNSDVTAETLYENRNKLRAPYTPGLIGYWKMDEGHGTQVTDIARSRHMQMPTESWYINNENRAAHLDGEEGSALKIDVSSFQPTSTDDFAYEMWFRGNKADNQATSTLMSVNNMAGGKTSIGFDSSKLKLKVSDNNYILSDKNYLDGNWHHLAFNVRRGISAIAYMDGEPMKVLPESNVPGIMSQYLVVGGEVTDSKESNRFTGDVDEIRIWKASVDAQLIKDRMYERIDSGYPGLEGYFPMEDIHRNPQGTVQTYFSLDNLGDADSRVTMVKDSVMVGEEKVARITQALNAPGLKVGSSKMRLDASQYDFTVSDDELYLTFPNSTLPQMDGNEFFVTVSNIKDEHGNKSWPVSWKFHCDFASLKWNIEEDVLSKPWDEAIEWQVYVANQTGTAQSYELSGMPTWLTVDNTIGTITGNGGYVKFRLGTDVPVGRHTAYIYLTDQLGIRRVLKLNLTVTGDVPDWTVDPDLYESNMTLTGQIYIDDKICENTDTKIAAFDDMDLCRGVASPKYVRTRDAYYVDMVIYGASATDESTGERSLEFKLYDASTGTIRPLVGVIMPGKEEPEEFMYIPDVNRGSYDEPVVFQVAEALEQHISLARGWTWMSFYLDPLIPYIDFVLPKDATILKRFRNIKSQTDGFATVTSQGKITGKLTELLPGQMYKMQLATKTDYDLMGLVIDVKNTTQTMHPGYNWIGTLSSSVMSVGEAFSELQPEPGDRVKSRTAFAEYSNKGYWEGTLESIVPGEGYIYRSKATVEKTFHYPSGKAGVEHASRRAEANSSLFTLHSSLSTLSHFSPVDPYQYPDNLSIIAVVKKDGQERDDAEVGAFIGGECRGTVDYKDGWYFLTVMGLSEDDSQKKMELRVWVDGEEYVVDKSLSFISDAAYGTLDEPVVLDVDALTGISALDCSPVEDDDWWTLQGFKIGRKPTLPGVYIHHGEKVTIKRKK